MPTLAELEALVARRDGCTDAGDQRRAVARAAAHPDLRAGRGRRGLRASAAGPPALLNERGTLFLVAADHPARGALRSGADPLAMADRRSLLDRLVIALAHPDVDGVLGSPDVVEELLLLGALEGKVVIGSMNRGGLDGASWTMDDRFTGYDAGAHRRHAGSRAARCCCASTTTTRPCRDTIEACAHAVSALAGAPAGGDGRAAALPRATPTAGSCCSRTRASLARAVTVASALGTTSAYTWLKTPACDDPDVVYAATTLPCVVLGGAARAGLRRAGARPGAARCASPSSAAW